MTVLHRGAANSLSAPLGVLMTDPEVLVLAFKAPDASLNTFAASSALKDSYCRANEFYTKMTARLRSSRPMATRPIQLSNPYVPIAERSRTLSQRWGNEAPFFGVPSPPLSVHTTNPGSVPALARKTTTTISSASFDRGYVSDD